MRSPRLRRARASRRRRQLRGHARHEHRLASPHSPRRAPSGAAPSEPPRGRRRAESRRDRGRHEPASSGRRVHAARGQGPGRTASRSSPWRTTSPPRQASMKSGRREFGTARCRGGVWRLLGRWQCPWRPARPGCLSAHTPRRHGRRPAATARLRPTARCPAHGGRAVPPQQVDGSVDVASRAASALAAHCWSCQYGLGASARTARGSSKRPA
jgi:hypothetical protein